MTGFVQGQELGELYSNCYLYCLPSDVEGMPISLLEAMSYGCRVLTSDIEECTQLTGGYGSTFKKANAKDLKEKLEDCLSTPIDDKKEMSKYILKKYNWDEIVNQTINLYKK